jgi:hypothetical protein
MIIGISGLIYDNAGNKGNAGAGKDTVADILIKDFGYVRVAFADVMKRFAQEIYQFSDEQLWGPSEKRNAPDPRYRRTPLHIESRDFDEAPTFWDRINQVEKPPSLHEAAVQEVKDICDQEAFSHLGFTDGAYLTPRHCLMTLGTEWGREMCWEDTWAQYAMNMAKRLLEWPDRHWYDPKFGLVDRYVLDTQTNAHYTRPGWHPIQGVCFSDLRFKNEFMTIRRNGGAVVRVKRPVQSIVLGSDHQSENDLNNVPDGRFDYVIDNTGTLDDLVASVKGMVEMFKERGAR